MRSPLALLALLVLLALTPAASQAAPQAFVFYEVTLKESAVGNSDVYGQSVSSDGQLRWGPSTASTCRIAGPNGERRPDACSDGAGGAFVAVEVELLSGPRKGDVDVLLYRVGPDGKHVWSAPAVVGTVAGQPQMRPRVAPDGKGGVFVVYEEHKPGGDIDLRMHRYYGGGAPVWQAPDGTLPLSITSGTERNAQVLPDGSGGVFVVFEWAAGEQVDIEAQRVDAAGNRLWFAERKPLDVAATDAIERDPAIAVDGAGGLYVAFEREPRSGDRKGNIDVYAQRITSAGTRAWTAETGAMVASSAGGDRNPAVCAAGSQGIVVAFEFYPTNVRNSAVMAQLVTPSGSLGWREGRNSQVVGATDGLDINPALAWGGGTEVIAGLDAEVEVSAGRKQFVSVAQKLTGAGAQAWAEGKGLVRLASSTWNNTLVGLVPDGQGGAIGVIATRAVDLDEGNVFACRIDGSGQHTWRSNGFGIPVANSTAPEGRPVLFVTY